MCESRVKLNFTITPLARNLIERLNFNRKMKRPALKTIDRTLCNIIAARYKRKKNFGGTQTNRLFQCQAGRLIPTKVAVAPSRITSSKYKTSRVSLFACVCN